MSDAWELKVPDPFAVLPSHTEYKVGILNKKKQALKKII